MNKNFKILIIFVEIKVIFWLVCAHALTTRIIFHTRRTNTLENVSYELGFYVTTDVPFFAI